MSDQGRGYRIQGRARELEVLRGVVADARAGSSRVLVLRGEPGVGKTALLDHVTTLATGFRCVRVAGVESDMELAFAAVQQLCTPLMAHIDELPEPQRAALNVALGLGVGPPPDRFLVGLAVLSLIATSTAEQPLLCVVDDAQWLDQVSTQTLAFIARRLLADPVALVLAARDTGAAALVGLPELHIDGLPDGDARELLNSVIMGRLDDRVRDRIVAETRGIPLGLLEMSRHLTAEELAGGFASLDITRPGNRLEDGFVARVRALPADTRQLLLVAAAEPVGDSALFLRAAAALGIAVDALAPAEAAGFIEFGPRMRFRHPLMRSAAYRAADLTQRRQVHRALAEAIDEQYDPDRRAWHAAIGTPGHDDAVATELESSAGRAQNRGGVAAAAAFLERAATLTSDPSLRSARALAAAQAKRDAAAPEAARDLLSVAETGQLSDLQRAQIARLRAQMEFARSRSGHGGAVIAVAGSQLLRAAQQLETLDDDLARETYLEAFTAAVYAGRLGASAALAEVADGARRAIDRATPSNRPIDLLLSGWADRIGGVLHSAGSLRTALEMMCRPSAQDNCEALHWMSLGSVIVLESAAAELWDDDIYRHLACTVVRQARQAGALAVLPQALVYRAGVHLQAGEFVSAANLIEEASSIAAAIGDTPLKYHSLSLAIWRGDPDTALRMTAAVAADGTARGEGRVLGLTGYLTAILHNGLGRYEEAFAAAREACRYEDRGFYGWCLAELIEAAARTGEQGVAAEAVERLEERAGASGTDWGLGTLARAQALLADDDNAEALFTEAIERLERTQIAVHLARSRLVYGEWLRRSNRRGDARRHLSAAHEMFTRMGAQAFADRAHRELIATGDKARKQPVSSGDDLTAQEAQIARLAADGLTNPEIGAHLFLSTHTVEWHLRKVFVKLRITSRRQLRTLSWAT